MSFDWSTLALQTVNFLILVWLLQRFLYRPVLAAIEKRRVELAQQNSAARAAEEQARAHLAEVEAVRAQIAAERSTALAAAQAQAEAAAVQRRRQAEQEAQALLDAGRNTLAGERTAALAEARSLALDVAADAARRALAELPPALRADAWLPRITRELAAQSPEERARLAAQITDQGSLKVLTATALSAADATIWSTALQQALGVAFAPAFEVDAALVAGAELHFPNALLRFGWPVLWTQIRAQLQSHEHDR